jgi:hypothetical protein
MHLFPQSQAQEKLDALLNEDLEGRKPSEIPDLGFVLQQGVVDSLLAAIQIETVRLAWAT